MEHLNCFVSLCSFISVQAVYQLSGPVCSLLEIIMLLTFISCFVSPFEKLQFFPRSLPIIITPYSHDLYTKMLQVATIRFRYIAQSGGEER